jgi:uncharacterized protein (DUF885 family)
MNRLTTVLFALAAIVLNAAPSNHDKLNALIEQEWQYRLREFPEMATAIGDNRYNDRLTDYSPAAFARRAEDDRAVLAEFKQIPQEGLTADDKLNLALMLQQLQVGVDGAHFNDWEMPVNQMNGPHLGYAGMARDTPFKTAADYENYVKRLRELPKVFDQLTADMRLGIKDGLMPPEYLLQKVASESEEIAAKPVNDSMFTDPLKHFPADITVQDRKRLEDEITPTVSAMVLPAYAKFAKFVKDEYAPKGRKEYGIWALPDGAARYRQDIHEQTTTDMSPEKLHTLGLKQVAQIDEQMLAIAKAQGYGDLKSFNHYLQTDKRFFGTSGEQVLGLYEKYKDQMYAKLPLYFGRLPRNKLVVVPMESFRAPHGVPADYSIGAGDGSRPGRINVNGFDQDPFSEYGRLQNLMWRSIRLVVDTGVHSQHWSRQQMIDFFHQHTAMDDQNVITEVDRYIAWPGQALGYKLGEMTILKMRAKAQDKLKDKFDIKAFHDAVLDSGPMPLSILEQRLNDWIAAQ